MARKAIATGTGREGSGRGPARLVIHPGRMTLDDCRRVLAGPVELVLADEAAGAIDAAAATVAGWAERGDTVYGVTTGFGKLAQTRIAPDRLERLQANVICSHAVGVGAPLSNDVVRLMAALKANSLGRGFSGVRRVLIEAMLAMVNRGVYPVIPAKGSVGASGDLAPLAHLSAALIGEGRASYDGRVMPAREALAAAGLEPLTLAPKEGVSLINGTQASTALALAGLFQAERLLGAALVAGAMTVDAARGSDTPFDARIHAVRGHGSQVRVAHIYRDLLHGSAIRQSHIACSKVQDPYSLRCQPQVMGACLGQLQNAARLLETEANAVSDNPLVFAEDAAILSGGNFHAEPVAFAADGIALALAEIGSMSERRTALLVDANMSGLPAFLVREPGLNSGFMMAQVTAAALVSENKILAHPASVDSIPTSANQEDHVSMAMHGARRLADMAENAGNVVAIELLAAAQGIDLLAPLATSEKLARVHAALREHVAPYGEDRYFAPDIEAAHALLLDYPFHALLAEPLLDAA
ncbi:MAG: histidine ammonia-lyase [Candidatus Eiseniibacteriota bacterium]